MVDSTGRRKTAGRAGLCVGLSGFLEIWLSFASVTVLWLSVGVPCLLFCGTPTLSRTSWKLVPLLVDFSACWTIQN